MTIAIKLYTYLRFLKSVVLSSSWYEFSLKILPILSKLSLALPAAFLFHFAIRRLTPHDTAQYKILAIEKAIFNEDLLEILGDCKEVQVFGVNRAVPKALALGILPKSICDDATYVSDDKNTIRAKERYFLLWKKLWMYLCFFRKYDAVITGNWCYWAERELATALESLGVPFLVMHKEGIKPPERSKLLRDLFRQTRGKFTGRRVLVYHEDEKDHQIEGGISRLEQIKVVGMPRLDKVHTWRKLAASGKVAPRQDTPMILCLAFIENNFLPSYSGIQSDLAWKGLCLGTYQAMMSIAQNNNDINVIIRPRLYELNEVNSLIEIHGPRPNNLFIIPEGEILPLIQAAWVVCGHNSTALLEAMAAGKKVIVPDFAETLDARYSGYIVELGEAVEHANSAADLAAKLIKYCRVPAQIPFDLDPMIISALRKWTGNGDGNSAERARRAIIHELMTIDKFAMTSS